MITVYWFTVRVWNTDTTVQTMHLDIGISDCAQTVRRERCLGCDFIFLVFTFGAKAQGTGQLLRKENRKHQTVTTEREQPTQRSKSESESENESENESGGKPEGEERKQNEKRKESEDRVQD